MKRSAYYMAALLVATPLFAGCSTQSRLEMDYGTSYKLSKMNQTLDLQAEKNLEPVYGLDGPVAQKVIDKYVKEFEKSTPAPSYIINLGGTSK